MQLSGWFLMLLEKELIPSLQKWPLDQGLGWPNLTSKRSDHLQAEGGFTLGDLICVMSVGELF